MFPWSDLELDPASASERDVKRAYAKKLKVCRPDQDPEGFRKLHDAYTAALEEIQWGSGTQIEDSQSILLSNLAPASFSQTELTEPSAPQEDEISLPFSSPAIPTSISLIEEAFWALDAALGSGQSGIADLVRGVEGLLYEHPDQVQLWGQRMHDLITRFGDHPDLRLRPEAMLFELEHGGCAASYAIIDRLDRQAGVDGLSSLARLFISNKGRIANQGTGLAAAHLACALAFWAQDTSSAVADLAYENLDRGERELHMQYIDRNAAMAEFLQLAPSGLKSFWRQQLLGNSTRESWDGPDGQLALRWIQSASLTPHIYQTLFNLIPKELSAAFKRKAAPPISQSSGQGGTTLQWEQAPAPKPSPRPILPQTSISIPFRFAGLLIFLLVKAALLVGTCNKSSSDSPNLPAPRLDLQSGKPARSPFVIPSTKVNEEPVDSVDFKDLLSTPEGRTLINPDPRSRPDHPTPRK